MICFICMAVDTGVKLITPKKKEIEVMGSGCN
jgi:hypothetical protein